MSDMFENVLAYIDDHIYEKINLCALAELVGYSPFYFSKLFSDVMGMPVTGYIRLRKLQFAIVSLLKGQKVLDVAMLYAFDSHEGFTRAFTQLGRGLPLSTDLHASKSVMDKILSGSPITNAEYSQMGDLIQPGLQTVNSLCETLKIIVKRDEKIFQQDYVRGIAQHELYINNFIGSSGTEIILKPDMAIFGNEEFSLGILNNWVKQKSKDIDNIRVDVKVLMEDK